MALRLALVAVKSEAGAVVAFGRMPSVIHSLTRAIAAESSTVEASGGIRRVSSVAMRVSNTELANEPGLMTRLFASPRLLFNIPLMIPEADIGVEKRASQLLL